MRGSERRADDRSWKLAASLLGFVALIAASLAVNLVDLAAGWELAVYFVVIVSVLLGGTVWLVPDSRAKHDTGDQP